MCICILVQRTFVTTAGHSNSLLHFSTFTDIPLGLLNESVKDRQEIKSGHKEKLSCAYSLLLVELKKRRQLYNLKCPVPFFSSALSSIVGISISDR